jgi:hypothetical protein
MFSIFVATGADKDATENWSRTLPKRASRKGGSNATDFGRFLVRQGVRVGIRDKDGQTAEDYARGSGLTDLADCLREAMERNRDEPTSHGESEGEGEWLRATVTCLGEAEYLELHKESAGSLDS